MSRGFEQISTYVDQLGVETAFRLIAGWGGKTLYVPGKGAIGRDHLINFVLGDDGADALQKLYGHQTIDVPVIDTKPYALKADVVRMIAFGVPVGYTARYLGITSERVKQILKEYPGSPSSINGLTDIIEHIKRTQQPFLKMGRCRG